MTLSTLVPDMIWCPGGQTVMRSLGALTITCSTGAAAMTLFGEGQVRTPCLEAMTETTFSVALRNTYSMGAMEMTRYTEAVPTTISMEAAGMISSMESKVLITWIVEARSITLKEVQDLTPKLTARPGYLRRLQGVGRRIA